MFAGGISRKFVALFLWMALLCWAGGIMWLSSLTPQELPEAAFIVSDKINHFVAFAVGGWIAGCALRISLPQVRTARVLTAAVVLVSAFGALDEALQLFTPGRTGGDVYDWIADFLGAVAGASLTLLTHGRLQRHIARP